eukprot:11526960-Karenia_brevis.AAC.1
MSSVKDNEGNVQTDRVSIANVFADFYQELYAAQEVIGDELGQIAGGCEQIPDFTEKELNVGISGLKGRKGRDGS